MIKQTTVFLLCLFLMSCQEPSDIEIRDSEPEMSQGSTVVIVRHAEKEEGDDPGLTPEGIERARVLATITLSLGVDVVITSHYKRTVDTGKPSSTSLGIPITQFEINQNNIGDYPATLASIVKEDYSGSAALIVTHSNLFMLIVNQFVTSEMDDVIESEYDRIATIHMTDSDTTLVMGSFGRK